MLTVTDVVVEAGPEAFVVGIAPARTYTSRRLPAPQYSLELPAHGKLQSEAVVFTDPAEKLLPQ
jgi:hypothetical protein